MSSESKKILVPVGFSDQSFNALNQAAMFAKPLDAEVVLLSVVELNGLFKRIFSSDEKMNDFKKEVTEKLQTVADEFEERYKIKTTTMVAGLSALPGNGQAGQWCFAHTADLHLMKL